jgi:hypothetical protein
MKTYRLPLATRPGSGRDYFQMKTWCRHIVWLVTTDGRTGWAYQDLQICGSWKLCPICGIKRPRICSKVLTAGVILFLLALGSGCSTNGHYADGINHWPVQGKSVDSGSN